MILHAFNGELGYLIEATKLKDISVVQRAQHGVGQKENKHSAGLVEYEIGVVGCMMSHAPDSQHCEETPDSAVFVCRASKLSHKLDPERAIKESQMTHMC